MKFFDKDIDEAIAAIELPEPLIRPVVSHAKDYLYFRMNRVFSMNQEKLKTIPEIIVSGIKPSISIKLNVDLDKYYITYDRDVIYRNVNYAMQNYVCDFIAKKGGFTNNRLSSLYKWYKNAVQMYPLTSNEKFMADLYEFTKFSTAGSMNSIEHLKVCRTLLTLIKDRYESLETKLATRRKNR